MAEPSWFQALTSLLRGPVPQPVDRGGFEDDLALVLEQFPDLGTNGALIEVGAGSGRATLQLADRVRPPWNLLAFEPEKRSADRLKGLIDQQGLSSKVRIFASAITEHETMVTLHVDRRQGRHRVVVEAEAGSGGTSVLSVRLDGHLGRSGLTRVGLVVVDVGGLEPTVLDSLVEFPLPVPMFVAFRPQALEQAGFEPRVFLAELSERHLVQWVEQNALRKPSGAVFEARLRSEGGVGLLCRPLSLRTSEA